MQVTGATGSAYVPYVVGRNPSTSSRTLQFLVAGQNVSVPQGAGLSQIFDLDGDGHGELLWQHQTDGRIEAWLMFNHIRKSVVPIGQVSDTNWKIAGVGDLNHDGQCDFVWQNVADGRTAVWFMNGTTVLWAPPLSIEAVPDTDWRIGGVTDMNDDGRADLVWHHRGDGRLAIWYMNGTTVMSAELLPYVVPDTSWKLAGAANVDIVRPYGSDLVWHNEVDGRIAIWFMDGTTLLQGTVLRDAPVPDPEWKPRAVMDLSGPFPLFWGAPEIIWQNVVTGEVGAWFLGDDRFFSGGLLDAPAVTDPNWHLVGPR